MSKGILVAFASPSSDAAETEFNRWYDVVHVPDLLRVAGFTSARRFKISDAQMPFYASSVASFKHQYLAIYEVESADPQEALLNLTSAAEQFEESEAMNYTTLSAIYFDQVA